MNSYTVILLLQSTRFRLTLKLVTYGLVNLKHTLVKRISKNLLMPDYLIIHIN